MPIQTSQITTETNGNLSISPNGTGETLISSVDVARADAGTTEDTPVSVAPDGTVKKADLSTLPQVVKDNLVSTDLIAVQKADGDFYYIEADSLGGPSIIDPPNNATLTITPTPGGDGSAGNPFLLTPVTVTTSGETAQTVETFAITGAPANAILYVTFTDNQGGRFQDKVLIADASGNIAAFQLTFIDEPESTAGTTYTGKVRFGQSSVYCSWNVNMQLSNTEFVGSDGTTDSPNASPPSVDEGTYFGTGTGTWADGAKTLSATGDVQFQVNGGGYGVGSTSVSDGDTVDVIFDVTAVDAAADGATITGRLSSADGLFTRDFSMVKDITPSTGSVVFGSLTNVPLSSTQQSGTVTPSGYNANLSVTAGTAGTNEMTNILVSIDGGAFSALPQTMYLGQTLEVKGDVGATLNTTYTININVGGTTTTFEATTASGVPSIQKPSITSPSNGSTGLTPDFPVVSDSYVGNNSPGPHNSSDWEVYEGAYPLTSTNTITAVNQSNTWTTQHTVTGSQEIEGMTFGNGLFVAVGRANTTTYSTDAITWSAATNIFGTDDILDVGFGNGVFVAVGMSSQVATSTDGNNWTDRSADVLAVETKDLTFVSYGNGVWIISNNNNTYYSTNDGVNWTVVSPQLVLTNAVYDNGLWVAGDASGDVYTSTNGISWTFRVGSPGWSVIQEIKYGNGLYIASSRADEELYTSPDGVTWTQTPTDTGRRVYGLAYNGDYWLAGCRQGEIGTSPDGINWTNQGNVTGNQIDDVVYANGLFVIGDYSGVIKTSVGLSTDLTIAGAQTDGFEVGWSVDDCGGGAGPGTILSLDDTQVVLSGNLTGFAVGENICSSTSGYTQVVNSAGDTSNLTSYTLTSSEVQSNERYYSRVKYNDDGSTGSTISSDFSDYSEFTSA